jgi:microsomal epoxide hydrolase
MARLVYRRYGAHGGDWGPVISRELGRIDAAHVTGVHLTMVYTPFRRIPGPSLAARRGE